MTEETTIVRSSTKATVRRGGVALTVERAGPLDSDFWLDWWILDRSGRRLRRVRDLDSGIYTARAMAVR